MDIHYDETSPTFLRWGQSASSHLKGKPAGTLNSDGYTRVTTAGKRHQAHRLIWELHKGDIPEGMVIDHADGDKTNNAISNLRLATRSQNSHNQCRSKANTSGVKGVSWNKEGCCWVVMVAVCGKNKYGGRFRELPDAIRKVTEMRQELHGEFARD